MEADSSSNTEINSSMEERQQSVHSFRIIDTQQDSESDKDLIIHSLNESLHIHKEILERIQNEKEEFQQQIEKERQKEKEALEKFKKSSQQVLDDQNKHCEQLESIISSLRQDLEKKKEAYQKLEVNFYSYVKQIRVTDDDLSTIQPEISHLLSQLNNTCMGLKAKMDREAGTRFVFNYWSDKVDLIRKHMMTEEEQELLDTSYITLFVEKYLITVLLNHIMDVPIHLGVSINDAFQELDGWMTSRNKEWANRLRQQVCALIVQQPGDEEDQIQAAKSELLNEILSNLGPVYPTLQQDSRKIENLIQRCSKLNLAVKGQEIKIKRLTIEEGVTQFDPKTMKATAKGKPNGIVLLSITPTFVASDEFDNEHGFVIPGKVFCINEEEEDTQIEKGEPLKKQKMDETVSQDMEEDQEKDD
ncbi:uncharacterized protein BX663DRAFT_523699 [Cokeromyces recurvatus]|uniref:uncharacterized protein n=1 Tax=Cokeromyces recurvatus TaxID=90255 RepID=UPI00221E9D06|nr:uncharacterized protein BX663DRAFT_523699 [Cokeromyces recurvatus]KAI7898677.1 hypothetical protein BX663DRAFT_523699 [Cokeromyces recurvatus]